MNKLMAALTLGVSFIGSKTLLAQEKPNSDLLKDIQDAKKSMKQTPNANLAELLKLGPEQLSAGEKDELIRGLLQLSEDLIQMENNIEVLREDYLNELGASSFKG